MLLARQQRWLGPVLVSLVALVGAATPFVPPQRVSVAENRALAPAPKAPRDWTEAGQLPRQLDSYIADHFAFRRRFVKLALRLNKNLGRASTPNLVTVGRDGWLFLTDGLLRSTGAAPDPAATADYARYVCAVSARLRARGTPMLFTLVPSPGDIYPEHLPAWVGPPTRPTDYDRLLARLAGCGVRALDLRPPLIAAKGEGQLYRQTDSHWTIQGAMIGFNAIVHALGRPDWAVRPETMAWREEALSGGDLPRLAGLEPRPEKVRIYARFEDGMTPPQEPLEGVWRRDGAPYRISMRQAGPTVLVIGDSFTESLFAPLFRDRVGGYVWLHQDRCGFDWTAIERTKPDYVILAPTERNARCRFRQPHNMPP